MLRNRTLSDPEEEKLEMTPKTSKEMDGMRKSNIPITISAISRSAPVLRSH
jgi:hypothetical protein